MSAHTPGPWRLALTDDTAVIGPNNEDIAATVGDYGAHDAPIMEANARLIAAAPELLEALQGLVSGYVYHPDTAHLHTAARAAIAKATGAQ